MRCYLDTGSSDLWSISTDCTAPNCGATFSSTPQISPSSLQSANLSVRFDYGDSAHQTFASGIIGSSSVSVASLKTDNQFLAACNKTNSNVSDGGLSGIFGIGFPSPFSGSVIFSSEHRTSLRHAGGYFFHIQLLVLMDQNTSGANNTDVFISELPTQGPFISRLIANDQLKEPMFTVHTFSITLVLLSDYGPLGDSSARSCRSRRKLGSVDDRRVARRSV